MDEIGNKRNLASRTGKHETSGTNNPRLIYDRDLFGSAEVEAALAPTYIGRVDVDVRCTALLLLLLVGGETDGRWLRSGLELRVGWRKSAPRNFRYRIAGLRRQTGASCPDIEANRAENYQLMSAACRHRNRPC